MNKPLFLILVACFILSCASAEFQNKNINKDISAGSNGSKTLKGIVPGKGGGAIVLGMTPEEVINILGKNPNQMTYQNEYDAYAGFGYIPEQELVFQIGFDYLLIYTPLTNSSSIPAWKLYFKNNKLVYINFSNFIYPDISDEFAGQNHLRSS